MGQNKIVFLNNQRLQNYPRIMLLSVVSMLVINFTFREGWLGAFGQLIGGDFIAFYSAGFLYRFNPERLYSLDTQLEAQIILVFPTKLWGVNIYTYPPYVALLHSSLTIMSYLPSFIIWTSLTLLFLFMSTLVIQRYILPTPLVESGLNFKQLLILFSSFLPFIIGLEMGQNHGMSLFLVTGIMAAMLYEKWLVAGILAGFLVYKPHFVFGFIIIWFIWKQYKPIIATMVIAFVWTGIVILQHGIGIYFDYFKMMPMLLKLPYLPGAGGEMQVTPYGFLLSILPQNAWRTIISLSQVWLVLCAIGLCFAAYIFRNKPMNQRIPVLILAVLFPFIVAPHTLVHDLVILFPVLSIWARQSTSRLLLYLVAAIYLSPFLLIPISYATGISFLVIIPISLLIIQIGNILNKGSSSRNKNVSEAMS